MEKKKTNNLNIVGQTFGKLTAIESTGCIDSRNRIIWRFICSCGNKVETSASNVKQGRKISCGCAIIEHCKRVHKTNVKPDFGGPKQKLYSRYKREAIGRGYLFELTKTEFLTFIDKRCYYCNSEPLTELYILKDKTKKNAMNTLIYNGVDRKNNDEGYNINNCVTCCFKCNRMKMDVDHTAFLNHINKIIHNLGVKYDSEVRL